ncbi:MAG: sigma-70 family RNA polymerase sigma factor [Gemmatimonadaceae bacterium]
MNASGSAAATPDDVSLIRGMTNGDEQSLGALYDRWSPSVYALASRMLRDPSEAEEVVEETFWQAWRQAGRYEAARSSVSTWLLTIARSRAVDRLRSLRRSREDVDTGGGIIESIATDSPDPAALVDAGDRRAKVVRALAQLPPEQRDALELAYFSGFSQTEIAERTGLPLGTVKTRMRLALQKLRSSLTILQEGTA